MLRLACIAIVSVAVLGGRPPAVDPAVFINEFHYDNTGTDAGEFIEVAGPAGTSLTGWTIVLYNGATGQTYDSDALSGTIPNQGDGFGTVSISYPVNGIQNGSPDAIALVDASSAVVQFLSYEGTFAATNGPAIGMTSVDIGVGENGTEAVGLSLQLKGAGTTYSTFTWTDVSDDSPGAINAGQSFSAGTPVAVNDSATVTPGVALVIAVLANDSDPDGHAISITALTDPPHGTAAVSAGGVTYAPDAGFQGLDSFTYTIQDTTGKTATATVNLLVATLPLRIRDIQGRTHFSTFLGFDATGVQGVVTALSGIGFYIQDPDADGDVATSEGIFVFTGAAGAKPAVGDRVSVNGRVSEFVNASRPADAPLTELSGTVSFAVLSAGNVLPAPVVIGTKETQVDRLIPTGPIDDDGLTSFDPSADAIDFFESLESMRVRVNNAVAVMGTNGFGEIVVLSDGGQGSEPRTHHGGVRVQPGDFNSERILLDDEAMAGATPEVHVGDKFLGPIVGVMTYAFSNYRIAFTEALPAVEAKLNERKATTLVGKNGRLTVGTCNLENLSAGDARIPDFAALIIEKLKTPDIVALEEVGDDNGTAGGVVSSDQTLGELAEAIEAASGVEYSFRYIAPQANQDGGEPGRNIRVAFLFRPGRVSFIDRAGGDATTPVAVQAGPQLSISPGRIIDPEANPALNAFTNSRKPLVGEFEFQGRKLFLIANHFNSKGGDDPLFGKNQPPTLVTETQRLRQAAKVNAFVQQLQAAIEAAGATAGIIVMGDLNDFEFSTPLATVKGDVLDNLMERITLKERYTYDFEGNSQVLDHILIGGMFRGFAKTRIDIEVVHVNADFSVDSRLSDHDPVVARFKFDD